MGSGPSVRDNDTTLCNESLHGGHRVGAVVGSSHTIGPQAVASALQIAEHGIVGIFGHNGIDVAHAFARVREAFDAAMYEREGEGSYKLSGGLGLCRALEGH
jgi:hypothetical protein